MGDASQVLDVLRDVLLAHMNAQDSLPAYRVRRAIFVGQSGRLLGNSQLIDGSDTIAGLRLTMESGDEFDLMLSPTTTQPGADGDAT